MRRRQGESCESQWAKKKKGKQRQGEEINKKPVTKTNTQRKYKQGEDEETTRRVVREPAGKPICARPLFGQRTK